MTVLLVVGWFVCGLAGVSLAKAMLRAVGSEKAFSEWHAMLGPLSLIAVLIAAVALAVEKNP